MEVITGQNNDVEVKNEKEEEELDEDRALEQEFRENYGDAVVDVALYESVRKGSKTENESSACTG